MNSQHISTYGFSAYFNIRILSIFQHMNSQHISTYGGAETIPSLWAGAGGRAWAGAGGRQGLG